MTMSAFINAAPIGTARPRVSGAVCSRSAPFFGTSSFGSQIPPMERAKKGMWSVPRLCDFVWVRRSLPDVVFFPLVQL